jgi:hypothetical protein
MQSLLQPRLVQHQSGLWEASAVLEGQELHFGYFSERVEAQRTLDVATVRYGNRAADPEAS